VGIDLELADCAAAGYQAVACRQAGPACPHDPDCAEHYHRLLARAGVDRPGESYPWEFRYRRFTDINRTMHRTGMGYPAEPELWTSADDAADLRWRSQTVPGRSGIPAFKLRTNDRWLVTVAEIDEALAAYARVPAALRAVLETGPKWTAWLAWLAVARDHGGFEAE
jgi:hypothetical protein